MLQTFCGFDTFWRIIKYAFWRTLSCSFFCNFGAFWQKILCSKENKHFWRHELIPELRDLPYSQRLKSLNLETLEYRRTRADLLEVYRIKNIIHEVNQDTRCSKCPGKHMLQSSINTNTRGHSQKLQIHSSKGGVRHNFFSQRVVKFWNALDEKTIAPQQLISSKTIWLRYCQVYITHSSMYSQCNSSRSYQWVVKNNSLNCLWSIYVPATNFPKKLNLLLLRLS